VGGGGLVSGRALFYVAISVAVLWEVLWVSWCRPVWVMVLFAACATGGQAPWPARHLGLSGSQRLRGQGRPQAVA